MKHSINWQRDWNEKQIAADRPYAVLTIWPLRKRIASVIDSYPIDFREWLAFKLAPWLNDA